MVESIGDLLALTVGLVVFFFLWQSFSNDEQLGRDGDRQLRHQHRVSGSGLNRLSRG
jgi:hypothetical protein